MFQVPSSIQSVRTLVDGGNKLDIITRELNPEEMTELFKLKGKEGWFLFKENIINNDDIAELPDVRIEKSDKTPSQRLRDRMFVYYNKTHSDRENFNNWYIEQLEKIGLSYLDKLN
jgi:hypothetical protein